MYGKQREEASVWNSYFPNRVRWQNYKSIIFDQKIINLFEKTIFVASLSSSALPTFRFTTAHFLLSAHISVFE